MSLAAIVDALAAQGCTAEQIASAVRAHEAAREARRAKFREGAAERQRRFRERRRHAVTRDTALPPSPLPPSKEAPHTPKENSPPISPSSGEAAPAPAGHRLPADFEASTEDRAFGRAEGLTDTEIDRTVQDLRLWAAEATGDKALRADWHATLRRFIRRDAAGKRAKAPAAPRQAAVHTPMVYIKRDTPQGEAWWTYTKTATGKSPPIDQAGGWRFPAPWPPGFNAAEASP